ncbi:GPW/gp25 family protein [Janthinobacterium sp. P210006]|uniref:GPW/gp25 family protein n=1 Tax=Janthinobacterium sp. P210006 TaxID=3112939 RepID=UPI003FA5EB46
MHAATGRPLSGLAHILQSVSDILTTPIGSRLMRRRYGSEVPELIDQPLNSATVLRIYAATAYAIRLWEPRLNLTGLQLETGEAGAAKNAVGSVVGNVVGGITSKYGGVVSDMKDKIGASISGAIGSAADKFK